MRVTNFAQAGSQGFFTNFVEVCVKDIAVTTTTTTIATTTTMAATTMDYSNTATELNSWFGLQSPTFMTSVLAIYLLYVLKVGPELMKRRQAYELKTFIAIYNLCQVLACVYIVLEIFNITSNRVLEFWRCSMFEPNTRAEHDYNRLSYFVFWLKLSELSETVVFVLRKKQNQISKLHVYHHVSTLTLVYVLFKYYRGGSALYALLLNSNVHIIMYLYYFAAAVCDKELLKHLTPIKKSITTIQMLQFVLILMQAVSMWHFCTISPYIVSYYACVVSLMFYGFYDFYKTSYTTRSSSIGSIATIGSIGSIGGSSSCGRIK